MKEMSEVETAVKELLKTNDGHGIDHVERVRKMALEFAEKEGADKAVVELAVWLHDVDDYKLFGEESAANLTNANRIIEANSIDRTIGRRALEIVSTMGYNKYLDGIRPETLEGWVASDADMCDAIGAQGILRTHAYILSRGGVFFDRTVPPVATQKNTAQYKSAKTEHAAQHFFDKLLVIPSILMTDAGREEGQRRQRIMVDFLRQLFIEEDANDWIEHLDAFLESNPAES